MGRRVLAMLLSMVLFVILFDNSESILSYATIPTEENVTVANTQEVSLDSDVLSVSGNDSEIISATDDETEETIVEVSETPTSENNVLKEDREDTAFESVQNSGEVMISRNALRGLFSAVSSSSYAVISIDGNPDDDPAILIPPEDLIESMQVKIFDSSNKEIPFDSSNSAKISLNDTISVRYVFKSPLTIHPVEGGFEPFEGINIRSKARYALPSIPKVCSCPGGFDIEVTNGGESLGTIHFDEDGNAVLTVAEFHTEPAFAEDAIADLARTLNLSKEHDGDVEDYSLTFGSSTYHVKIKEFMPQPPTVEKVSGGLDSDGNITWKVTVTNDGKPIQYEDGYTFTDEIGDGQSFVEGSLMIGGAPVSCTQSGNTISWNYKDNTASKKITFEYKTHVDFLKLTAKTNESKEVPSKVTNKIKVTAPATDDYAALSISKTAEDTVKKSINKWIEKSGTNVDATGKATWTIVIRNNGFTLKDAVLHDKIITDGTEIEVSNFKVVDASNNDVAFAPPTKSGNEYLIKFTDPMAGNAVYTVTYDTQIKDYDAFLKGNHAVPKNEAKLTYKYDEKGDGTGNRSMEGPGISKEFTSPDTIMPKAAIKKSSQGFDPVNHTMDWLVEINNNKQALTNVSVSDAIPAKQVFKSLKWVKINDAAVSEPMYSLNDSDPTNIVISFGDNIVGKKASFYITTELTDEANYLWAGNKKETFTNKATISSAGNPDVTDSASKEYSSTVLSKKSGNYNYNTHEIEYTITVNQNEMAMNGVTVTDVLDENLEYVEGSSSVAGTVYDTATNTLTFSLGSISAKTDIVFKVKVKDGDIFTNKSNFSIPNSASMISDEYSTETKVSCSTPINNNVITKEGKQTEEVVEYTIKINDARQDLYREGIDEVIIEDIIGASMFLDKETVKLYKADIDSTGKFSEKELVDAEVKPVEYTDSKTILRVVVPKSGRNDAYILKYTARMLNKDAHDYSNIAHLKGYGNDSINLSKVSYSDSNFSTVKFSNYVYYIGELKDLNDGHILPGVHFELLDPDQGDKVIAEATSDKNGQIMFAGSDIKPDHTYHLKQTDAPDGYLIPDDLKDGTKEVYTDGKGITVAKEKKPDHTEYNSKPTRVINFELLDEGDKTTDLTGLHDTPAKITVYKGSVKVWETGDGEFKAVYGTEYKVVEETTPFGYLGHSEPGYTFKIDEVTGELVLVGDYEHVKISGDTITMYDEAKESMSILIDDISEKQGKSVKGGTFEILDETDTVIKSWTGDGIPKEVELPEGTYKLKRVDEPFGFEEEDKVLDFKVIKGAGGELEIEPITVIGDIVIDGGKIKVPEKSKDSTAVTVDPTEPMGSDPLDDELDYKLTPRKYSGGMPSGLDDTPIWKKSDGTPMELLPQIEYDLTMTDKDGKTVSKIVIIDEHGKLVVMDYPSPKKAAPKPAPPTPDPTDSTDPTTPGGSGDTSTSAPASASAPAETTTTAPADSASNAAVNTSSDSNNNKTMTVVAIGYNGKGKKQLAKTGGFFGTPAGYAVGMLLMLVGLFMAAGKKKSRL